MLYLVTEKGMTFHQKNKILEHSLGLWHQFLTKKISNLYINGKGRNCFSI